MSPERRCMPLDQWPAEDRRRWIEGLRAGDLFEASGAGACWSPQSQRKFQRGYGRWLTWLHATGQLDNAMHPGDRVTPARVAAYVTALAATCAPYTRVGRIQELYATLRILAPRCDWRWLAAASRNPASPRHAGPRQAAAPAPRRGTGRAWPAADARSGDRSALVAPCAGRAIPGWVDDRAAGPPSGAN